MLSTTDINGIEIFSEGQHGEDYYTRNDLDSIIDTHGRLGFQPTVKLLDDGTEKRIFGAPALGYVSRLYRSGQKLIADFTQVPQKFAEIVKSRKYKKLGTEIYWNYKDDATGMTWPRVLRCVSFAVDGLRLDTLAAIESLFARSAEAHAYDEGQEYHLYSKSTEEIMNSNDRPESLTERSKKFAKAALEFAVEHNIDYPTAVNELIKIGEINAKKKPA